MDNYDLLSITIDNEFLKNAIRWSSQGLVQAIRLSVRRPLDVNGSLHVPFMMSSTDMFLTTESLDWEIKEQS
jgi:hypothetical protein